MPEVTLTTEETKALFVHRTLKDLRKRGWLVAVHNDYIQDGRPMTFWLFAASHGPYFVKGEADEDCWALNEVVSKVDDIERWSRNK